MKKVAVIGLGNISSRHRKNLKSLFPKVELLVMSASGRIPKEIISDCDSIAASIEPDVSNGYNEITAKGTFQKRDHHLKSLLARR